MRVFTSADTAALITRDAGGIRNRSLLVDRFPFFADNPDDKKDHAAAKQKSVEQLCRSAYFDEGPAWQTRRDALAKLPGAAVVRAKLGARLIINQAGGVIENAGISLDRNSGVPFIPGSAVKGITRAGANLAGADQREIALVFGWTSGKSQEPDLPADLPAKNFAGTVAFLPALPTTSAAIEMDIVNVHHPKYYAAEERTKVAHDDENPIPNLFPTVRKDTEFQFIFAPATCDRAASMTALLGLDAGTDPLKLARAWLIAGITAHGIGAKTAAGYGWFDYDEVAENARAAAEARRRAEAAEVLRREQEEQARRASLSPRDRAIADLRTMTEEPFANFAKALASKSADEQKAFCEVIRSDAAKRDRWKTWKKKKPELAEAIRKAAVAVGEALP